MQEQHGHYGQLILEPAEPDPVGYDVEHSIVLSDWTFEKPHRVLWKLKTMEGYYNFQRPTLANIDDQMKATGMSLSEVFQKRLAWDRMRLDPTDIADITGATYTYLMNGKAAHENHTFIAKPGQRVRLRIVNASTMTFYDVRIPGLPMTVVQADGQNIKPVETDEFRIAVAETYDVIVTLPDARAYTLFAETMDRSGYARGTLAPRQGMSADVPEQRRRPMLTMADMGMMMHGEMKGMDGENHEGMHHDMPHHASGDGHGRELPTTNLIQRIKHGPDQHGPASITMAQTAYRRLDYPGAGLGDDDWRVLSYSQLRALEEPYGRRPGTVGVPLPPALSHGGWYVPHRRRRPLAERRSDPCQVAISTLERWSCSRCCWRLPPRPCLRTSPTCRARRIARCTADRPHSMTNPRPVRRSSNRRSPQV